MHGPTILANYLAKPSAPDVNGNRWQYNSQSDRHSKVGCWGVALDLLESSALLQKHAAEKKVVLGVNHSMRDFGTSRQKKLDLVVARPAGPVPNGAPTFRSLAAKYDVQLTPAQETVLDGLPDIAVADVGAVLIALEAKAAMTAHQKARPRLYDELNSSHLCVHGASNQALAIAYVQINASTKFVSSVSNRLPLDQFPAKVTQHKQPQSVQVILDKIAELPRRTGTTGNGFDGVGVTILDFVNDGGPVDLVHGPPAPGHKDPFHYEGMIVRMAHEYDSRFHGI